MVQTNDFQRLTADIKSGKCALVLGPEMFSVAGQPLQHFVKTKLLENFGEQIADYHERDGFFLLKNPDDKPEMQDEVQFLYKKIAPEASLLRQIVEIPFSLVLSVNPDTFLRDQSIQLGLPHRFAWFDIRKNENFDLPDGSESDGAALRERIPFYYNLCGCIEKPSTLVLDYDDLFRLFEGMLGAPKLPEKLLARLKDTSSYLFFGFRFDRWHTQMLLRLLDVKNAARRFAIHSPIPVENDTRAFLLNHFRIKFLGDEIKLLDDLHDDFSKNGLLRPAADGLGSPAVLQIKDFLRSGNLEKAVAALRDAAKNSNFENDATQLAARFAQLNSEKNKGTMDARDIFLQQNLITDAVLNFSKELG